MKKLFIIPLVSLAVAGCHNATNSIADKPIKAAEIYDTIPMYDKNTGEKIGDTIVAITDEKDVKPDKKYNGDTVPVYQKTVGYIGDTILSSHKFIPAKEKGKMNK